MFAGNNIHKYDLVPLVSEASQYWLAKTVTIEQPLVVDMRKNICVLLRREYAEI